MTAPKTELVYFGDTYKTSCDECKILSCEPVDEPKDGGPTHVVVLDRTIAYPAGGGQPSDTGRIVSPNAVAFVVTSVASTRDGTVTHLGSFETEGATPFAVDDEVTVTVDADRRLLHARIHSAGHLLDVAMTNIGFGPNVMVPAKGLHQPDQAYVEYTGKVDGLDKDKLMADLKAELTSLVTAGGGTKAAMMGYDGGDGGVRGRAAELHPAGLHSARRDHRAGHRGVPVRRDARGGRQGDRRGGRDGRTGEEGDDARELHHRGDEGPRVTRKVEITKT